jgi:hypothetical protein
MFKDISNFTHTQDYLPIFTSVLITDLVVILLLNTTILQSRVLREWYATYNISAVIADVLIIFIGIIIARYLYSRLFKSYTLLKFIGLAVSIQIIHDLLFYIFFKNVPRGVNRMLDTFKDYAKEVSYKAVLSDSGMMILASLLSAYLVGKNLNTNIIIMIVVVYLTPYILYN